MLIRKQITKALQKDQQYRLWCSARQRALKNGIEFTLNVADVEIPERCPLLHCKLTNISGKGRVYSNASIDRINPNEGYIKENIQVLSDLANRMKQNASPSQLVTFAKNILLEYE